MPEITHDNARRELAVLFSAATDAVEQRLQSLDIPLTAAAYQLVVERDRKNPDAWQSSSRIIQRSILSNQVYSLHQIAPLLTAEVVALVSQCAEHLIGLADANLPFFCPIPGGGWFLTGEMGDGGTYEVGEAKWVASHLLLPALYVHLGQLSGFDRADDTAARFAEDVLTFLRAPDLTYHVTIPLAGLDIAGSRDKITAPDVTVFRLTSEAQGDLMDEWGMNNFTGRNAFTSLPLVALRLVVSTPRTAQNPLTQSLVAKWLCALQLHGYALAGINALTEGYPSWVSPGKGFAPINLPARTRKWSTVSPASLDRVAKTVRQLTSYNINGPRSAHDLALHRFSAGAARESAADAIVDFVIALESLLLPAGIGHGDLSYRFHVHGAHYLAKTKSERTAIAEKLTDLYRLRSRLVHGGKYPAAADVESARVIAEDFARQGLLKAVTNEFPTANDFRSLALGV